MDKDYINKIKEKFKRMDEYDRKLKIAEQKNTGEIDGLVDLVNSVFQKHGVNGTINSSQIRFNADYVGNIYKIDDKKLSELIFEHIYPKPQRRTFSHYTRFDTGINILDKGEFWLFNLIQNFDADEFKLFYKEHQVDGYESEKETYGVKTGYLPLMSEIFALCLTSEENNSPSLWEYFGDGGTGLKLTFEIDSKIPDFRKVHYSSTNHPEPIPLLKDLFEEVYSKYNYIFNFSYMSKIGAFYIKGTYDNEDEYRFLIKRSSDSYNAWNIQPIVFQNDISYIILPFESEYANFKLTKVEKGPNCKESDFNKIESLIKNKYPEAEIVK